MTEVSINQKLERPVSIVRRISWAAVFAGVAVALSIQIVLNMLGLAIGASTVDPLQETRPMAGLGAGAGIWFVISSIIALYFGGWVAGRMAGFGKRLESMLHGLIAWAFATLLAFYFVNSLVGGLIGGAANMVSRGIGAVGQGMIAMGPQAAEVVSENIPSLDLSDVKNEARQFLSQSNPNVSVVTVNEMNALIDRVFTGEQEVIDDANRESVITMLITHTAFTRDESNQIIDRWQVVARNARQSVVEAQNAAMQRAREMGDAAARNVSRAAIWTFIALVLGAVSAAIGGLQGMPRDELTDAEGHEGFGIPRPVH